MARQISVQETFNAVPSGYDSSHSSYSGISSSYPVTNGYDGVDTTDYAYITCNTGSRATTYISYTFDVSDIPANAIIDSVSCRAKVRVSSTSYISTGVTQLYSGGTAKGSATTTRSTTATTYTLTPGTWTRSELDDIQVRFTGTRGTSNTTRAAYLYFYGADLTVEYSVNGMAYTIGITSNVDEVEVEPATQEVLEGGSGSVRVYSNTLDDYTITDNDTDVTESFVRHAVSHGGTIEAAPASYTVSGSINGTRYQSTIGHTAENPSSQTGNDYSNSSGSDSIIYYHFNFDEIPDNATISSMEIRAYGHLENASQSSEQADLAAYYGTTAKGSTVSYTSSSSHLINVPTGTWTVAELKDDARVGFTIGYYGGLTTGITWEVTYTTPSTGSDYYWEYTLSNVAADHFIVVDQEGAFVPPEEDPQYTYYPITISSINATTNPHNGTTRVQEGTSETITISPSDPRLMLALDNGVDITSQLVGGTPQNTYTVDTQVSGASYGFSLNSSTGYYVSTNGGVGSSASVARVSFDLESSVLVTIQYINQGESQADYGMFGKLDTTVSTTGNTYASSSASPDDPNNYYYMCAAASDSTTTVKTLTYEIPMGEHYIDIKYAKDQASDSGNDSLQWKILSVEATSAGGDYTYTLTNINQKHSLIFVFGDVEYYFITSSGTGARLYPDGQMVKLKGYSYSLTVVPDDANATVTVTDNNVDVSSSLVYEEGVDKSGNKVANYTYKISNVTAAHNLVVTTGGGSAKIFMKVNGAWAEFSKVYKKINGSWVEQTDLTNVFDSRTNYKSEI